MSDKKPRTNLSADQIAVWLKENPDFLVTHPELVPGTLKADETVEAGNIVSFEQYSLQRLRRELAELRSQLDDLVGISKRNSKLVEGIMAMVVDLVSAPSLEELTLALELAAMDHFKLHAALHLNLRTEWGRRLRGNQLKNKDVYYGDIEPKLAKALFDKELPAATICMLPEGRPRGVIAFASEDRTAFDRSEDMGSLLLEHIAAVIRARLEIGWKDKPQEVE